MIVQDSLLQRNIKLSRMQRRRIAALDTLVEQVCMNDGAWFEAHPHRQYRIRPGADCEVEQLEIVDGRPTPPELCWYVAVKSILPGFRLRLFTPHDAGLPTADVDETTAAKVYCTIETPQSRAFEAAIRAKVMN